MVGFQGGDRLVVGVDFGTTFSGVAEHYSGSTVKADDINVIRTWPGGSGTTSDKVPSEIAYIQQPAGSQSSAAEAASEGWSFLSDAIDEKGEPDQKSSQQPESTIQWGYQLRPEQARLRCMKLLLDPGQDMPAFVSMSEMNDQLAMSGRDATSAVADYLREVREHADTELVKRYGAQFIKSTRLVWILTVPAVWSDAAKNATLLAAKQAGMGSELTLISEPEAAAVYTLQAIQPSYLKPGDNFVVVDAGGGTVDLISYEIIQSRPLRVEESVPGSGACCGSAMLNVEFENYVRTQLGQLNFEQIRRTQPKTWQTALKYFEEYVKRNYDPDDRTEFDIPLPGVPDNVRAGVEQGYLTLPAHVVGKMFATIMVKVIKLVDGQVKKLRDQGKSLAGVVLVGGFGQSRFLYKALQRHVCGGVGMGDSSIEILQPANAWTAVVRGAVLRGLEGAELVISRKARRHYGVTHQEPFIQGVHPNRSKFWDNLDGQWKAKDRMTWLIKKGANLSSTLPVVSSFYQNFRRGNSKTVEQELIVCDEDNAPPGYDSRWGASTGVLCRMPVNLATVPQHLWRQRVSASGEAFESLDYEIGMQMQSGGLKFDMRVDGVVYGNITAEFD